MEMMTIGPRSMLAEALYRWEEDDADLEYIKTTIRASFHPVHPNHQHSLVIQTYQQFPLQRSSFGPNHLSSQKNPDKMQLSTFIALLFAPLLVLSAAIPGEEEEKKWPKPPPKETCPPKETYTVTKTLTVPKVETKTEYKTVTITSPPKTITKTDTKVITAPPKTETKVVTAPPKTVTETKTAPPKTLTITAPPKTVTETKTAPPKTETKVITAPPKTVTETKTTPAKTVTEYKYKTVTVTEKKCEPSKHY